MHFRRFFAPAFTLLIAAVLSFLALNEARAVPVVWLTNYDAAVAQSKKAGLPMLLDFTGSDWCPGCILLEKQVFSTDEFTSYAANHYILMTVDFPSDDTKQDTATRKQNQMLLDKYGVQGFPTILVIDANGKVLHQMVAYDGKEPKAWLAELAKAPKD
jgi:thiol:disulfide interchange protein